MNKQNAVAFASGVLFALGLGLSGMTQPAKVIAFLDVTGAWDPGLAFVMVGAIGVHALSYLWTRRSGARPVLADRFKLPTGNQIDARLVTGAALFGLGWGTAGYCPGPAFVSFITLGPSALLFVAVMLIGMGLHAFALERPR